MSADRLTPEERAGGCRERRVYRYGWSLAIDYTSRAELRELARRLARARRRAATSRGRTDG